MRQYFEAFLSHQNGGIFAFLLAILTTYADRRIILQVRDEVLKLVMQCLLQSDNVRIILPDQGEYLLLAVVPGVRSVTRIVVPDVEGHDFDRLGHGCGGDQKENNS